MKRVLVFLGAGMLVTSVAFGQADVIIKKRAREIRDQNNVRKTVYADIQAIFQANGPVKAP